MWVWARPRLKIKSVPVGDLRWFNGTCGRIIIESGGPRGPILTLCLRELVASAGYPARRPKTLEFLPSE